MSRLLPFFASFRPRFGALFLAVLTLWGLPPFPGVSFGAERAAAQMPPPFPDAPPPDEALPGLIGSNILTGWQRPDGIRIAALKVRLDPGWQTFWRVPGEAGIPPEISFAGSRNLARAELIWPTPRLFDHHGLRTVGYMDEMLLPVRITPIDPSRPVDLRARLDIGICRDICVPVTLIMARRLSGPGAPAPEIRRALEEVPMPRHGIATCRVEPAPDGMRVTAAITLPEMPDEDALFEMRSTPMWVRESAETREGDQLIASAEFVPESARPFPIDPKDIRITVLGDEGAVEIDGCPPPKDR